MLYDKILEMRRFQVCSMTKSWEATERLGSTHTHGCGGDRGSSSSGWQSPWAAAKCQNGYGCFLPPRGAAKTKDERANYTDAKMLRERSQHPNTGFVHKCHRTMCWTEKSCYHATSAMPLYKTCRKFDWRFHANDGQAQGSVSRSRRPYPDSGGHV